VPPALLCETVTGLTTADLVEARDASSADLVELRLDGAREIDVAGVLAGRRRPVVVTCRPTWEGGRFAGSEDERREILGKALELGADFVDVEWNAHFETLIARDPARIVVSTHDFAGVPADLFERTQAMRATGAGAIKVAVMTPRLSDTLPLLEIARGGPAIVIGMGPAGIVTRLLAARFGSQWTYAGAVAPGQIHMDRMVEEFGFRRTTSATRVYGIVGGTAAHSLSPAMHNAAFSAAGIDAVYVPLCASDFADFETFSAGVGVEGASVTIPFKVDALRAARQADATAKAVGAANTLRRTDTGWDATNTDVAGFLSPIEGELSGPLRGARASVLGAGGAARAVVAALVSRGARVSVHARRATQAEAVASELGATSAPFPPAPGSWDLLVNTTPLGGPARRDESPLPGGPFGGGVVYDLTYGPGESRLVRDARAAGCRTLDGLPMLVAQAERQFEWWTGQAPAPGVMRAAVERRTGHEGARGSRRAVAAEDPGRQPCA
jgi:3-dehydroquinate dehydratase/shikimate dehydrogenase